MAIPWSSASIHSTFSNSSKSSPRATFALNSKTPNQPASSVPMKPPTANTSTDTSSCPCGFEESWLKSKRPEQMSGLSGLCAQHVRQLEDENPFHDPGRSFMEYRLLGRSGFSVPVLTLGT